MPKHAWVKVSLSVLAVAGVLMVGRLFRPRGGKGTRLKRPARVCYLCGKTEAQLSEPLTQDHVIADCFFPQPRPATLLTLPCCVPCQKEYSMDEEYIRNAFAPISNVSANADALQAWKKTHRSMKRRAALYADFLRRTFPVTVGGIKLPGLKFSQARTEKVMRKIVLGLHYHHTGMIRASQ
jgi:hypothetical protein